MGKSSLTHVGYLKVWLFCMKVPKSIVREEGIMQVLINFLNSGVEYNASIFRTLSVSHCSPWDLVSGHVYFGEPVCDVSGEPQHIGLSSHQTTRC